LVRGKVHAVRLVESQHHSRLGLESLPDGRGCPGRGTGAREAGAGAADVVARRRRDSRVAADDRLPSRLAPQQGLNVAVIRIVIAGDAELAGRLLPEILHQGGLISRMGRDVDAALPQAIVGPEVLIEDAVGVVRELVSDRMPAVGTGSGGAGN